jgi:hypothetical protein
MQFLQEFENSANKDKDLVESGFFNKLFFLFTSKMYKAYQKSQGLGFADLRKIPESCLAGPMLDRYRMLCSDSNFLLNCH